MSAPVLKTARICVLAFVIGILGPTSRAVLVAWDPNPPSEGVEGYNLFLEVAGVLQSSNNVGNVTIAPLPVLTVGVTYTIYVTAYNAAGESDPSDSITYTPQLDGIAPSASATEPADTNLVAGSTLTLIAEVTGTPPFHYLWFKNGVSVSEANSFNTFTIPNAQVADSGDYFAMVSNPVGTVQTRTAHVVINPAPTPPQFPSDQPIDQVAIEGDAATFSVGVTGGTTPFSYQWFRNGIPVDGANAASYTTPPNYLTDSGSTFFVDVSNVAFTNRSRVATLTVTPLVVSVPPSFLEQPQATEVERGGNAKFTAKIAGTPPYTFEWLKDGVVVASGTTNNSPVRLPLNIINAQESDAGMYSFRISNAVSTAPTNSISVPLTVVVHPATIVEQPQEFVSVQDQDLVDLIVTPGGTPPWSFQWYVSPTDDLSQGVPIPDETGSEYFFQASIINSNAYYFAVVANDAGAVTSRLSRVMVYQVFPPPVITRQPEGGTLTVGSEFTLSTEITNGPVSYQWSKDNIDLPGQTNSTLHFASLKSSDAGVYRVAIANAGGMDTSKPATLVVTSGPVLFSQPQSALVAQGSAVVLSVGASGIDPLSFQWFLNGVPVPGADRSNYRIDALRDQDQGTYKVRVSDAAGTTTSSSATVKIRAPQIILGPQNAQVPAGEPHEFHVQTDTSNVTYSWLHDRVPISSAPVLRIDPVTIADGGEFTVIVSNAGGSATSAAAVLTVQAPPVIISQNTANLAYEGTPFKLSVEALGAPPLFYEWRKNGAVIPGEIGPELSLPSPRATDAGTYHVTVRNFFGTTNSDDVELQVLLRPVIIQAPRSTVAVEGSNASFTVEAQGSNPLLYQWYRNGVPLVGAQSAALTLSSVNEADTALYHVIVGNLAGSVASSAVRLTVIAPPRITGQPQSVVLNEGAEMRLAVVASGTPPLSYLWFKNAAPVPEATTDELTIPSVTAADAGIYSVMISNQAGNITSDPASVEVMTPPQFVMQPQSTNLNEGSRSSFTIGSLATGSGPLSYQWFKDGVPIEGATNRNLTLSTVLRADAGRYSVSVSNALGMILSDEAIITISTPPVILSQPAGATILADSSFVLAVETSGTEPLSYQWFRNGILLAGATDRTLEIGSAKLSDQGIYNVRVVNPAGSISSSDAEIIVHSPPKVTALTSDQSIVEGGRLVLRVTAIGSGTLHYQWLQNGNSVLGAVTPNLLFFGIHRSEAGAYSVRISNEFGVTESAVINVTVITPPEIMTQPAPATVSQGSAASFAVDARANGAATYQWLHDGNPVFGAAAATFAIPSTSLSDAGLYVVRIANEAGSIESAPALLTVNPPNTPGSTAGSLAIKVSSESMILSATAAKGTGFVVESCDNLSQPHWIPVGTVSATDAGEVQYRLQSSRAEGARFFRLRKQ